MREDNEDKGIEGGGGEDEEPGAFAGRWQLCSKMGGGVNICNCQVTGRF